MLLRGRVTPKVVGAFLLVSTVVGGIPRPAVAEVPKRAKLQREVTSSKKPTKTKRKGATQGEVEAARPGLAFASMPSTPRPGLAFAPLPADARRSPAEIAVATARAQIGKPYRWGATGPSSFDCSGLTRYAWAAAGVGLPRSSRAQIGALRSVPVDELVPGDLVYRPGHIGLYIGDGMMVHAPQSGRNVEIAPLRRVVRAVRPAA